MATQRELIYTVKSILRGGLITDDDKISDRQVAFLIDAARATLLRQQINKGQSVSDNNVQTIKCLPVTPTDTSFDSNIPLNCKVFKSNQQIPKPIEGKNKDLITAVGSSEFGGFVYEFIPYTRVPYMTYTRFKRPFATLFNNYIYIVDAPYIENISVTGIYEQPNDVAGYDDCAGNSCFNWDSVYPMSSHLIDPAIKMVVEELSLTIKVPQDRTNNSNQALEQQSKTEEGGQG